MNREPSRRFFQVCGAMALCSMAPSVALSALASLGDWSGNKNSESTNNYSVLSPTSVGGTFQSRKSPAPPSPFFVENWYLRDASLQGGPLGFDDALSMSGKITISNPSSADPSWFFGWYSSTDYRYRLGFAAVQAVNMPPNAIRMQLVRGNGGAATAFNLTDDGTNSSLKAVTPDGTYDFTFAYTPGATNNLTAHIHPTGTDWRRVNLTLNVSTPNVFDRFGFLQIGTAASTTNPALDAATIQMIVSDLNYTGETQTPEPSASLLAATWLVASLVRRGGGRA
jgi:hypothetical protein